MRGGLGPHLASMPCKRQVWRRDGGQCAFVSKDGRRCEETGQLEYHHVVAYALGGQVTVDGIELRCRAHNAHEAERVFGPRPPLVLRERLATYARPWNGARSGRSGPSPHSRVGPG
jgi:5-methylcytosine-specific restriction endonuclease McrA